MREREKERAYGFGLSGEYKVGCNFHRQKVKRLKRFSSLSNSDSNI